MNTYAWPYIYLELISTLHSPEKTYGRVIDKSLSDQLISFLYVFITNIVTKVIKTPFLHDDWCWVQKTIIASYVLSNRSKCALMWEIFG